MFMKKDVESGGGGDRPLYPNMLENPQLRWSFIRKVYCILTFQLLLTVAVAAVVVFVRPIPHFIVSTTPGLVLYCVLIFIPFISTSPSILPIPTCMPSIFSFISHRKIIFSNSAMFFILINICCSVVPSLLLPPETPSQLFPSLHFYRYHGLCRWTDLRFY